MKKFKKVTEDEVKIEVLKILEAAAISNKEKMILELIKENDFYIKDEINSSPEDYDFTIEDVTKFEHKTKIKFF